CVDRRRARLETDGGGGLSLAYLAGEAGRAVLGPIGRGGDRRGRRFSRLELGDRNRAAVDRRGGGAGRRFRLGPAGVGHQRLFQSLGFGEAGHIHRAGRHLGQVGIGAIVVECLVSLEDGGLGLLLTRTRNLGIL